MTIKEIKIKYHTDVYRLKKIEQGDWIDLCSVQDYFLTKGSSILIDLGVSMELPSGYEALLAPRSSTFKKYGTLQTNSVGVVDNSYSSDKDVWRYPVYATREIGIPQGARICQFRIQRIQPEIKFTEVKNLDNKTRGGFGSTDGGSWEESLNG